MRLLRTEFRRFWSRRLTWATSLVCVVVIALSLVIAFTQTSADPPDNSEAAAEAADATESCVRFVRDSIRNGDEDLIGDIGAGVSEMSDEELDSFLRESYCFQDPDGFGPSDQRFFSTEILASSFGPSQIDDWSEDRPDSSETQTYGSGGVTYRAPAFGLDGILPGIGTFALVVAIVIGASFVGAEYKAGTVENLMLWEPRRSRLLGSKFAAGFVSSAILTSVLLAILTAGLYWLSTVHGSTAGIDQRFWVDVASTLGRAGLMGGAFFVLAMSISVIARNTTAAVGVVLGWFAISNIVIELAAPWMRRWELFANASSFIREGDATRYGTINGSRESLFGHNYLVTAAVVAAWTLAFVAASMLIFNRRDVD